MTSSMFYAASNLKTNNLHFWIIKYFAKMEVCICICMVSNLQFDQILKLINVIFRLLSNKFPQFSIKGHC